MCKIFKIGIVLLTVFLTTNVFAKDTYKIDATHSTFAFAVTHMQVGVTRGGFTDFEGEMVFDRDNLDDFEAWVIVKTESINTGLEARDNHLKNKDFFDIEIYPTIIFRGKKLLKKGEGYEIVGELTMHGVTREVSGPAAIRGPVKSPFGGEVIGLSGETTINRQDYNISWNNAMPGGGFVVGDEVKIIIDIEGDKK